MRPARSAAAADRRPGPRLGDDKALQFARDIVAKTNLLLTRAPRESLLQSGERVYAFGEIDSLIRAVAAEGLPVSQVVPQPVVVGQFGATIIDRKSVV